MVRRYELRGFVRSSCLIRFQVSDVRGNGHPTELHLVFVERIEQIEPRQRVVLQKLRLQFPDML